MLRATGGQGGRTDSPPDSGAGRRVRAGGWLRASGGVGGSPPGWLQDPNSQSLIPSGLERVPDTLSRFPEDFSFQFTKEEVSSLRFQFETSNKGRGGRRYLPHAFTEHGVANTASRSARPPSSGAPCRLTSSLDAPFISFGQSRPLGESNSLAVDWERA